MKANDLTTSRREILGAAIAVGGLAAATPLQKVLAAATLTPKQTEGPFYPLTRPLDSDADLTVVKGRAGRAEGKVIHVMGRVLNQDGKPVPGAKIELWQCNARGRYAHPADVNPAPLDPNFQGFGVQATDANGEYRFKTIKPAAYPIGPMNPDAIRTPHIHFNISAGNTRLVTQMYFPGEPENGGDLIFRRLTAEERICDDGENPAAHGRTRARLADCALGHRAAHGMKFQRFDESQLPELMTWFRNADELRTWGGPDFRFPFTEATFREDAKLSSLATWSLVTDEGALAAFGQCYERVGRCHFGRVAVSPTASRSRSWHDAHPGDGPLGHGRIRSRFLLALRHREQSARHRALSTPRFFRKDLSGAVAGDQHLHLYGRGAAHALTVISS